MPSDAVAGSAIRANAGLQLVCLDYGDWDMHADLGTVDRDYRDVLGEVLTQRCRQSAADMGNVFPGRRGFSESDTDTVRG